MRVCVCVWQETPCTPISHRSCCFLTNNGYVLVTTPRNADWITLKLVPVIFSAFQLLRKYASVNEHFLKGISYTQIGLKKPPEIENGFPYTNVRCLHCTTVSVNLALTSRLRSITYLFITCMWNLSPLPDDSPFCRIFELN